MPIQALVIDDSRSVRLLLREILNSFGFEVDEASDGLEGLNRLRRLPNAQLVLVDWDMPVMDGRSFVTAVRANPDYAYLRLLMVTCHTSLDSVRKALDAGADEYVMKPFDHRVIGEKISLLGFMLPS